MDKKKLTHPLLSGLKGPDRDLMITQLLSSEILLKRLVECIDKEIEAVENGTPDFESPSWAYKQAYNLGLKKGLTLLKKYAIIST
ncbi:MAG: hypothetical protein IIZ78_24595 [Clostridiales bacterium]|nr:hypothetical protein [Clostridiales bacterium]